MCGHDEVLAAAARTVTGGLTSPHAISRGAESEKRLLVFLMPFHHPSLALPALWLHLMQFFLSKLLPPLSVRAAVGLVGVGRCVRVTSFKLPRFDHR